MKSDQWMPGKNAVYVEDRVARLERMTAHLFRALHQAQGSNKASLAETNRRITRELQRRDPDTAIWSPPAKGTHESDAHPHWVGSAGGQCYHDWLRARLWSLSKETP